MKRLVLLLLLLFAGHARAQNCLSINGPVVSQQVWTTAQWNAFIACAAAAVNGTLTTPTITNPTIIGGTITGTTINGLVLAQNTELSGSQGITPTILTNTTLSGTTSNFANANRFIVSDTLNITGPNGLVGFNVYDTLGTGTSGPRNGFLVQMQLESATTATPSSDWTAGSFWNTANFTAGGTGVDTLGHTAVSLFAINPLAALNAGATNYGGVNADEHDISIVATTQPATITGTPTNGDVITLTFTPAIGSPIPVIYTVGTGTALDVIAAGLQAAIQNTTALQAVRVGAVATPLGGNVVLLSWPTQSSWSVSQSVSGSATETVTLGSVVSGASAWVKYGQTIIRLGNDSGAGASGYDTALEFAAQRSPSSGGWPVGIGFADPQGIWPFAPGATLIKAFNGASQAMLAEVPPLAYAGLDFSQVNFSGYSLLMPGLGVTGAGVINPGAASIAETPTGLSIDATGYVGTSPTPASGGAGYFVGDIINDQFRGQEKVSAVVGATGAVTALTGLVNPSSSSSPGSPATTTGGSGAGLTVNFTWTAATGLSLNPSGGPVNIVGPTTATGSLTSAVMANRFGEMLNVISDGGAHCNGQSQTLSVTMAASGHTLTVSPAVFASTDVGSAIAVGGVGPSATTPLITTISGFTNSNTVALTAAAATAETASAQTVTWGQTDDYPALQAFINAVPSGSTVYFPPMAKSCLVSQPLSLPAGINLFSYPHTAGLLPHPTNTTNPMLLTIPPGTAGNNTIFGLVLDGGGTTFSSQNPATTYAANAVLVNRSSVGPTVFDHVTVQNVGGVGIYVSGSSYITIRSSQFKNVGTYGNAISNPLLDENAISFCCNYNEMSLSPPLSPIAVYTGSIAGTTLHVTAVTSGTIIPGMMLFSTAGNIINNPVGTFILSQLATSGGDVSTWLVDTSQTVASEAITSWVPYGYTEEITGNTFINTGGSDVFASFVVGLKVTNNTMDKSNGYWSTQTIEALSSGFNPYDVRNAVITGNDIYGSSGSCIDAGALQDANIANNVLSGCSLAGISIGDDSESQSPVTGSQHVVITGNTLVGTNVQSAAHDTAHYGSITFIGLVDDVTVAGNAIANSNAYGLYSYTGTGSLAAGARTRIWIDPSNRVTNAALGMSGNNGSTVAAQGGFHGIYDTVVPTLSACGTSPSLDAFATRARGMITFGSGSPTSCTLTFNPAFPVYEYCTVTPSSTLAALAVAQSLGSLVIAGSALSGSATYACDGM